MIMENAVKRPEGLWPFTELVLDQIELLGCPVLKIEAHDPEDAEDPDFLWGKLTPHLQLSEGEYMKIDQEFERFSSALGMRGCSGGDPTWGGQLHLQPTVNNAALVAAEYCSYFTWKSKL